LKKTTSARGSKASLSIRESKEEKAVRYLAEGRVKVRAVSADGVEADVRGSKAYKTTREGKRWTCDCPAWQRRCSHVIAVQLVT
jgi:uncharacterized Zn finger protein